MGFLSNLIARIAEHTVDLDAHTYNKLQVLRTGEYMNDYGSYAPATGAKQLTADVLYASNVLAVARTLTVDRLAINVTVAAAAGKKARLGLYQFGADCYPGALLVDGGEVAVDSTGVKAVTIDQQLTKGLYWLVCITDGTPAVARSYNQATPLGIQSSTLKYRTNMIKKTGVDYGALPDPFTAGGTLGTEECPGVYARLASLD